MLGQSSLGLACIHTLSRSDTSESGTNQAYRDKLHRRDCSSTLSKWGC